MEKTGKHQSSIKEQRDSYWSEFYSKDSVTHQPSDFACYVQQSFNLEGKKVLDIGCGNGRDAEYFVRKSCQVIAIDKNSNSNIFDSSVLFLQSGIEDLPDIKCDIVYSRFFIHAIPLEFEELFWDYVGRNAKEFHVEARSDKGAFEGDHYRRFINLEQLKQRLDSRGFSYDYLEGSGLAVHENEDPIVIRIHGKTNS